ncbi:MULTISPECIES: hypothetical protein [Rhodococcus]|uniref:hypothetical protein n=1 Tax=Rhodococcus TaxID=1827 RepID=UPI001E54E8BE|nr:MULTISPECIES: hypothetical protein [Rhodococcus]BDB58950.1 hypothetical protein RDE2_07440 [Rhodococcus sp. RDE2]
MTANAHVVAPLNALENLIATSSMDWSTCSDTAWIYGIVLGWDDEPDTPAEDQLGAMSELAREFNWTDATIARLRALNHAYEQIVAEQDARASVERVHVAGAIRYGTEVIVTHSRDEIYVQTSVFPGHLWMRVNADNIERERDISVHLSRDDAAALRDRLSAWLDATAPLPEGIQ